MLGSSVIFSVIGNVASRTGVRCGPTGATRVRKWDGRVSKQSLASRTGRANPRSGHREAKNPLFDSKSRILAKHASKNVRKTVKNVPKTARFGWISVEKNAEKFIDGTRPDMMGNAIEPRMVFDSEA